jgi:hypothetical protein
MFYKSYVCIDLLSTFNYKVLVKDFMSNTQASNLVSLKRGATPKTVKASSSKMDFSTFSNDGLIKLLSDATLTMPNRELVTAELTNRLSGKSSAAVVTEIEDGTLTPTFVLPCTNSRGESGLGFSVSRYTKNDETVISLSFLHTFLATQDEKKKVYKTPQHTPIVQKGLGIRNVAVNSDSIDFFKMVYETLIQARDGAYNEVPALEKRTIEVFSERK